MGVLLLWGFATWGLNAQGEQALKVPAQTTCSIRKAPVSDAEAAEAREEYDLALDLYKAGADVQAGRAGGIRVLLGKNRVADADKLAMAWVTEQPGSALAMETLGEVQFRDGRLEEAYRTIQKSKALDACVAREYLVEGELEEVTANFARSKLHFEMARRLDAFDPAIYQAWMGTLPWKRRLEERAKLVKDDRLVNEKDRARMVNNLAHAEIYHADDCGVVTAVAIVSALAPGNVVETTMVG